MAKKLVDAREAAWLLGVSESTLVRMTKTDGLPFVSIGRAVRDDPADPAAMD